jgi:hypothetical protein
VSRVRHDLQCGIRRLPSNDDWPINNHRAGKCFKNKTEVFLEIIIIIIPWQRLNPRLMDVIDLKRAQKNQYPEGFYLVYIVNTNDDKCVNSRMPAPFRANRTKEVTFTIQETVLLF